MNPRSPALRRHEGAKRLFDVAASLTALAILSPLLALAAIGIRLSSKGPILYRASRLGRGAKPFTMYKFRTMEIAPPAAAALVTAKNDPRVFWFGAFLRRCKIDELPQLLNILKGDMSVIGPRPEDPEIVRKYYAPDHIETLDASPGLSSPGSIYFYTHGEDLLQGDRTEEKYVDRLLPIKLALDMVYLRNATFGYDLAIILRTVRTILSAALGRHAFPLPPEMEAAQPLVRPCRRAES